MLAALCATAARAEPEELSIKGSNTVGGVLMPALIEGWIGASGWTYAPDEAGETAARLNAAALDGGEPRLRIALERLGSSTSFKALADGSAEIGMSSRAIKDAEAETLGASGVDMRGEASEHVIALDGLALIVSPQNPLLTISPEEAAQVFSGEIADWRAFRQRARPIRVHARDDQSGTFDTFNSLALKPFGKEISPTALRYFSNAEIITQVSADPDAIGFVPLGYVRDVRALTIALECGLIVAPDAFTVKSEEYPLGRRLHLYTIGAPRSAAARQLVAFAKSDAAQPLVAEAGFVTQSLERQSRDAFSNHLLSAMGLAADEAQRTALQRLFQFSGDSDRLSITFRFQNESDLLDAKSLTDAGRLARWLEQPENRSGVVRLMGFGDGPELSTARAEAARRAILINSAPGFDASRIETYGFGDAAPVACPAARGAARSNRRVEVWVSR
ncbi:MAG: substrate-binding domain-containing protein [Pseudomonadota bacterium]